MKHLGKIKIVLFVSIMVCLSMGSAVFAQSSFQTVTVDDVACYVVPEALDDMEVSDDTVFFLPVGVYEGYKTMFAGVAVFTSSKIGLDEASCDAITNVMYEVWSDDTYSETCFDESDAAAVAELWESAYYNSDDDEVYGAIANCLPEWAYQMYNAMREVTYFLNELYDFNSGSDFYDSLDDLYYYCGDDFEEAVEFINAYYPDLTF